MTMGARIKWARKRANLTQTELANECGVKRNSVSQWENGESEPRLPRLRIIAKATDTPLEQLVYGHHQHVDEEQLLKVPLIELTEAADYARHGMPANGEPHIYSSTEERRGERAFGLIVPDDSMHDPHNPQSFTKGSTVIIDPDASGECVLVQDNTGQPYLARCEQHGSKRLLRFLNPSFPVRPMEPDTVIIGAVKERRLIDKY